MFFEIPNDIDALGIHDDVAKISIDQYTGQLSQEWWLEYFFGLLQSHAEFRITIVVGVAVEIPGTLRASGITQSRDFQMDFSYVFVFYHSFCDLRLANMFCSLLEFTVAVTLGASESDEVGDDNMLRGLI